MAYDQVTFPDGSVFLITGGAGFIGSNLCRALLEKGYTVRCLDDLSTGFEANIEPLKANPAFTFIRGDIKDEQTCRDACQGVQYVLHQAAWGSVPRSMQMPAFYERNNTGGTVNMLEAARLAGVKKFVYASSSSVYGSEPTLPKREGREGLTLSPYALSKKSCEDWANLYARVYGLDTYGMRYFNVFGPQQTPDGPYAAVIPKFIRQLLRGEAPTIDGDGSQSRDFTYIENVIEANLKACLAPSEAAGQAFNIACGEQTTLLDIYWTIARALGQEIPPAFGPNRPGDIPHSLADISLAASTLGYSPSIPFAKGLSLAMDWYVENLKG